MATKRSPSPIPVYKGLRDNNSVTSGMLARFAFDASISSRGQTDRGMGELVSGNYFEVLGVQPALGRVFSREDDKNPGADPVAVLSYGYWTQHFGADPRVLNQTLLVNNSQLTIVDVAQKNFTGIQVGQNPGLFVPLMMKEQMMPGHRRLEDWNDAWLAVLARRKQGVSDTATRSRA